MTTQQYLIDGSELVVDHVGDETFFQLTTLEGSAEYRWVWQLPTLAQIVRDALVARAPSRYGPEADLLAAFERYCSEIAALNAEAS